MRLLYVIFLLPAAAFFIFNYIPMYGVIIAFKDFGAHLGLLGSPWNEFAHFRRLFESATFWRVFENTAIISTLRILFGFPAPILLALLITELPGDRFRRIVQSISYLPHFFSWVVLATIITEVLSPSRGIVGYVYSWFGQEAPLLLTDTDYFRGILVSTGIWQSIGWGSIVYLATISTINPELYESAAIDGAGRARVAAAITIPSLVPIMTVLFLLSLGNIMSAGFEQILNLYNPIVYEVADIIDTYVYRVGLIDGKFGFSAAVGLFKNVIGVALLLGANAIIRRFGEYAIW